MVGMRVCFVPMTPSVVPSMRSFQVAASTGEIPDTKNVNQDPNQGIGDHNMVVSIRNPVNGLRAGSVICTECVSVNSSQDLSELQDESRQGWFFLPEARLRLLHLAFRDAQVVLFCIDPCGAEMTLGDDGVPEYHGLGEVIARARAASSSALHIICGISDGISCGMPGFGLDTAGEMAMRLGVAAYCAVEMGAGRFEVVRAQPASKCSGASYAGAFSDARPSDGKLHEQGFLKSTLWDMHSETKPATKKCVIS
tara:strand:+ start:1182 stop:1940 length:759 start_codon:yes stop_codon:yes gene_type:complete